MKYRRDAFTLIELLVVIAIIALLISLLIPAIQAAREMARRSHCKNNIKQISLALVTYHDALKTFPPGNITFEKYAQDGCHTTVRSGNGVIEARIYCGSIGWPVFILPQLEQTSLYEKVNFDLLAYTPDGGDGSYHTGQGPLGDPQNKFVAENMPSVFACPSTLLVAPRKTNKDYGVNGGSSWPERVFEHDEAIFWNNSATKVSDIKDGLSNTFLTLECIHSGCSRESHREDHRATHGSNPFFWVNHASQGYVVYAEPSRNTMENYKINNVNAMRFTRGAKSDHPKGINASLCDGSVHFINENIDFDLYKALFTRAGHEVVKIP
ncbi:MAG: DUF1559 domain-containing protein [Planctomycetaceae bacterium]|nr:DUF1559 domain-containing protein [Planctomycetaceae bacterium]